MLQQFRQRVLLPLLWAFAYWTLCSYNKLNVLPRLCHHFPLPTVAQVHSRPYVPCSDVESKAATRDNATAVRLLLPSVGQTGTTSLTQAARELGLRVYHIEEKTLYAHGLMLDNAPVLKFAQILSACRLEVVSLEPHTDTIWVALQASPNAKVIISWREFPSWLRSSAEGGMSKDLRWGCIKYLMVSSLFAFPWVGLLDLLTQEIEKVYRSGQPFAGRGELTWQAYLAHLRYMRYDGPDMNTFYRGTFKVWGQEEAYLAHIDEIRRVVPQERLMEFDVKKHGYSELAAFLSMEPKAPNGTDLAGKRLPQARSKASWTNDVLFDNNLILAGSCFAATISLHIIHIFVFRWVGLSVWQTVCWIWELCPSRRSKVACL